MSYRDSDLDYKERLYGPDETELAERQAETAREQRWAEYVTYLRDCHSHQHGEPMNVWGRIAMLSMSAIGAIGYVEIALGAHARDFAETEGWDGVLNAIARAMREDEQYRKELVDRR